MLLHKTALARTALESGTSANLGLLERRILILADGRRTLDDIATLLGPDILPIVDRLLHDGYIARDHPPAAAPAAVNASITSALTGLLRATTEAVQIRSSHLRNDRAPTPAPASTPHIAPPPVPARSGQRRSLVAAKMYMLDMLSLLQHPDAVECKARIQLNGGDEDALLAALADGLRALLRLTTDSYGQRVQARLAEALPEPLLPRLTAASAQPTLETSSRLELAGR